MIATKLILFIFIFFIVGCSQHKALISNKADLIIHANPTKEVILYAQSCAPTYEEALRLARHNFSLLISTQISSELKQKSIVTLNDYSKTTEYKTIETSVYNNLIGAKYFNEPVFYNGNSSIYCTNIYYDFDYFKSFEIHAKNDLTLLKNIIDSFTYANYVDKLQEYHVNRNNLIFYLRFYYDWAAKYNYSIKINQQEILELDTLAQEKIFTIKDNELKNLKLSFINILENNSIVEDKEARKKVIDQLLQIRENAAVLINQDIRFEKIYNLFEQYKQETLNSFIKIKPICILKFDNTIFLQGMQYKFKNESYDVDGREIKSTLTFDKGLEITTETDGYTFKSSDYGNKILNLKVVSDNGLKSFCKKNIFIQKYDIRLSNFYLNMPINQFKEYAQVTYGAIRKEYPSSFLNSMLDSRKAYAFDEYYGLFVHDRLKCLLDKKTFNEKQLSCKYYKNQIELPDKGIK